MQPHEGGERGRGTATLLKDAGASEQKGGAPPLAPPPAGSHSVVGLRGPRDRTQLARQLAPFFFPLAPILVFPWPTLLRG